jgi:hypothetical protein
MTAAIPWSRDGYERSISSRCWNYTPYGQGWDRCPQLQTDDVLRCLVEQEGTLAPVAAWARQVVERAIEYLPGCPHWAFPIPFQEVLDAIGQQRPPGFIHGCYTASRERKERLQDYVFCLDAWLAGAGPEHAAAELADRGCRRVDWATVCVSLWAVLGDRTELKELLLRRLVHRQRWWIKSLVWNDDDRHAFGRDQFLGDVHCAGHGYGHYGNPPFNDPFGAELEAPEAVRMEARLAASCPDWPWFCSLIRDSWLCAPKAFRFLERALWCIGRERRVVSLPSHPLANAEAVPGFLCCQDTYEDPARGRQAVRALADGLRTWIAGHTPADEVAGDVHRRLGPSTPTKEWLAGLYLRKLQFLDPYGALAGA